ncbi:MAG: hypothetical protein H6742_13600 [Alphaproteobacteria bacterium]|nr:hypothetical protein [Alphaproteobacteria bacterium]
MSAPAAAPPPQPGDSAQAAGTESFGTFAGVVRPVSLTILGAMLYLREGWLVGQAGVVGALAIIAAALAITGTTALSLSSLASNVRVKPGGAFAIISQALGLEAGGAIGVPLYIAQAASSAMYVYAFTEAWAYIFPDHPSGWVAGIAYAGIALLAWRSAGLAFKAQAVMAVVIVIAILSAVLGLVRAPSVPPPQLIGAFPDVDAVQAFAIFFPAATGIMVGAGMSGSLADPRRAIPRGTMIAWGATGLVYAAFVLWYARMGTVEELIANKTLMIDRALVPQLVLAGLLSSTLMAGLSSLVAAPRLLQAMADHGVVPGSRWLRKTTAAGEPRNAVLATTGLGALGLAAGSLDAIAPVITSFFIMTYLAINAVVYLEQVLGMISFRPAFRISRLTPLAGVGFCLVGLSLGSPFGGVVEIAMVIGIYVVLSRRHIETPWETVRSGIDVTLAAWAARRAAHIERTERAWKPDLLVPVASDRQIEETALLAEDLARRNGSIRWVALGPREEIQDQLAALVELERKADLNATWTRLHTDQYMHGIGLTLEALRGALFPPNLVLVDHQWVSDGELSAYLAHCRRLHVGLGVWVQHPAADQGHPLGARQRIAVWLSDRSPDWKLELHQMNLDLPVLSGFLLSQAWKAELVICTAVRDPHQVAAAERFLAGLVDQARLPKGTRIQVTEGDFGVALRQAGADLHLFGMPPRLEKQRLDEIRRMAGGSCLWLLDSGGESVLA